MSEAGLYDSDFVLWSEHQGRRLRALAAERPNIDLDWENVAEEIESLGKSQRREVQSLVALILTHLLKVEMSASIEPLRGWQLTVVRSQRDLARRLADSPSLSPQLPRIIAEEWPAARAQATSELEAYSEFAAASIARKRQVFDLSEVLGMTP